MRIGQELVQVVERVEPEGSADVFSVDESVVPDDSTGGKYSKILKNIFVNNYDFSDYARAATIYWPGNKIGHGREDIVKFWNNLKNTFSGTRWISKLGTYYLVYSLSFRRLLT